MWIFLKITINTDILSRIFELGIKDVEKMWKRCGIDVE